MKTMYRTVIGFLTVLLLILAFSGCTGGKTPDEKPDISMLPFSLAEDYVIVRGDLEKEMEAPMLSVRKAIGEGLGMELALATDWVKFDEMVPEDGREILVGETNRPDALAVRKTLRRDDFTVRLSGERILILGGSRTATEKAVSWFCEHCIDRENGTLLLPEGENGYLFSADYPVDRLLLQGHDITEFEIVTDYGEGSAEGYAASYLAERIAALCGICPPVTDPGRASAACSIRILKAQTGDEGTYTVSGADGSIVIAGNGEGQTVLAINDFLYEHFTPETGAKEGETVLTVSLSGDTVKENQVSLLISFNLPDSYAPMEIPGAEEGGVRAAFLQAVSELPDEATVQSRIVPEDYPRSMRNQIWVSPDGKADAAGTETDPLTLSAGLDRLAGTFGGVLWLRGGTYRLNETLALTKLHSGTDDSPVFLSAWKDEIPVLTEGKPLVRKDFTPVTDGEIPAWLKSEIAGKVLVCDLAALGYGEEDLGSFGTDSRPIFSVGGKEQTVARYPNAGEEGISVGQVFEVGKVISPYSSLYAENSGKTCGWTIGLDDPVPYTWKNADDLWIFGSLYAEWESAHYPVTLDAQAKTVSSSAAAVYGALRTPENTYYFYNVPEELDNPGEWYLDKKARKLYYYPDGEFSDAVLVTDAASVISVSQASCVVLRGLSVTGTQQKGIELTNCHEVVCEDCKVYGNGTNGLYLTRGDRCGVMYSEFYANGAAQIFFNAGDRASLVPDHNFIQNCIIRDGGEQTGTYTYGVGTVISHNLYDGAVAMILPSNECLIEYNEFVHGSRTTADAGMIYVNGGDLSSRGSHIRYNYMHDMAASHAGVYIDDCSSGQYVYGNVADVKNTERDSTFRGKMTYRLHNGRECVFYNNISIGATNAAFADNANYYAKTSTRWPAIRENVLSAGADKVTNEVFAARYPIYTEYYRQMEQHAQEAEEAGYTRNALEDYLREPAWNVYENNIVVDASKAFDLSEAGLRTAEGVDDNLVTEEDPLDDRYQIPEASDIQSTLPDFKNVPFDRMGLCEN